jgi:enterochelin esterase-like enzyme
MSKTIAIVMMSFTLIGSHRVMAISRQEPHCETKSGRVVLSTVASGVYRKPVPVNIYLPPCYDADTATLYPVIYLLHGSSADQTQWPDLNVRVGADNMIGKGLTPFVVVMPGGIYTQGIDYGNFVIKDLLPDIELQFRVQPFRTGRGIGGLSLGGYWALKVAFQHPDLFGAVAGYSPVTGLGNRDDPSLIARQATVQKFQNLSIALDVGDQDSLLFTTRQLATTLRDRGLTVLLTIGHGGHNRPYWRSRITDYFAFFQQTLASTMQQF